MTKSTPEAIAQRQQLIRWNRVELEKAKRIVENALRQFSTKYAAELADKLHQLEDAGPTEIGVATIRIIRRLSHDIALTLAGITAVPFEMVKLNVPSPVETLPDPQHVTKAKDVLRELPISGSEPVAKTLLDDTAHLVGGYLTAIDKRAARLAEIEAGDAAASSAAEPAAKIPEEPVIQLGVAPANRVPSHPSAAAVKAAPPRAKPAKAAPKTPSPSTPNDPGEADFEVVENPADGGVSLEELGIRPDARGPEAKKPEAKKP